MLRENKIYKAVIFFCLGLLTIFIAGCFSGSVSRKTSCPEPGTSVQFAKVMNEGFARNYIGCYISTEVQFVATGKGAWVSGALDKKGYVVFRALPPGQKGSKNPLSGDIQANFVMIPQEKSDVLFSLNVGDILELTGGTSVKKWSGFTEVVFWATSAQKKLN